MQTVHFFGNGKSLIFSVIMSIFLGFISPSLFAQTDKDRVATVYELLGYKLLDSYEFSMSGEQQKYLDRTFYSGTDYQIVLIDDDGSDADLFLTDEDGTSYDEDTSDDEVAIISYSPFFTESMQVLAKNESGHYWDSNFTLLIFGK